ncbi:hypothetical protein DBR47_14345 [Paucibacter sp. KBW04]|uniref:hypothetical protein n=1 Tax=Paucibacter sp. KBW04 TaxID=2153361 RepID=UPI000F58E845|nr:hypothetical protein [Paucibacter sp. KBW04]RQO57970.1 hypothetical protein DBR47_14345 [Paucibacter sp. KBW04]
MAYCTGWTIPHIRDELDLPTLAALREQWAQFPPLPVMVAHYLGAAKPKKQDEQAEHLEDQDVIPTTKLSEGDFNALLVSMGLPTSTTSPTAAAP